MKFNLFALPGIALTIMCWGTYGPLLHKGQMAMKSERLKPLICVGIAYFVIAIVVPTIILASSGKLQGNWSFQGISWSLLSGTAGAIGALGIIWAMSKGGAPDFVMPLVFGGAPIVNVITSMALRGQKWRDAGPTFPVFLAGCIIVGVGAAIVLMFAPKPAGGGHGPAPSAPAATSSAAPTSGDAGK